MPDNTANTSTLNRAAAQYSYSTISADWLQERVAASYPVGKPTRCVFWERGVNDTYLLNTDSGDYSVRIYRHELRTREAIEFELAALDYLHQQGVGVAWPVARNEGGFLLVIEAVEGERYVVVTRHVPGQPLSFKDAADSLLFGKSVATMHAVSEGFSTTWTRPILDTGYLLDVSMATVQPFFTRHEKHWTLLQRETDKARRQIDEQLPEQLDRGFCHGDFHGHNAHLVDGELIHFDFDCCGYGLRAFDLATFKWSSLLDRNLEVRWPAFLEGYRAVRSIGDADLAILDSFVLIRHVWLMALHMGNAADFGYSITSDGYINHQMRFITGQLVKDAD